VLRAIRNPYRDLERALGYRFRRSALLETALVHRSYRFENRGVEYDNQRLEFLGDAALGLAAAAWLFERNADCNEGRLTSMRSQVTSGKALCQAASQINLGHYLRVGKGEEGSGGRHRQSNLEDALEAIIGAAYVDGGMRAVTAIFERLFGPAMETMDTDHWAGNPKGRLQEYVQRELGVNPAYRLISREGPAHAPVFVVEAVLPDGRMGRGSAPNKQQAESDAAAALLGQLTGSGAHCSDVTV
jgi:ribonuclease-3